MIELSGLRRYITQNNRARLEADIKFLNIDATCPADTIYIEIDANYGGMLVNDTYDPFIFVALYLAMHHKTDLQIRGNVSKRLYKNLTWYAQKILCDYSSDLVPVKIIVDGFAPTKITGTLIGAGISCGVDSLTTLYDRFIAENDPDYKINALFFFNCGANGNYTESFTQSMSQSRLRRAESLAAELNLPLCFVETNLHQFKFTEPKETFIFFATYGCILALQNAVKRYYVAGSYSYGEVKADDVQYTCHDLAKFCETFFIPLIQTERTELIVDGCQYLRVEKVKKLADWHIAQKYLNVCSSHTEDSSNCSLCQKCLRTLLTLEILGKLDDFAKIFDVEEYRRESLNHKVFCVMNGDKDIFSREILDLAAEYNFPMPAHRDCYVLNNHFIVVDDK